MNIILDNKKLLKRTNLKFINSLLKENKDWKILDIGCGYSANENANVIADAKDLSLFYKEKQFVQIKDKKLPFKDKEFNFVIASHVLEHVEEIGFFISELERISIQGYIELPTILEDNLVFENKKDHVWSMKFDDTKNKLLINKRVQFIDPILSVSSIKKLNKYFRESFIIEILWREKIDYEIVETEKNLNKISRLNLLKKFFSKSIRSFFKK